MPRAKQLLSPDQVASAEAAAQKEHVTVLAIITKWPKQVHWTLSTTSRATTPAMRAWMQHYLNWTVVHRGKQLRLKAFNDLWCLVIATTEVETFFSDFILKKEEGPTEAERIELPTTLPTPSKEPDHESIWAEKSTGTAIRMNSSDLPTADRLPRRSFCT